TGQEPCLLEGQPALSLEVGALRTGPMPTRVVPDTRHVAVRTGLDMTAEERRPTLHDGACGPADVGRERVRLLLARKPLLQDGLERHEGHRCLRSRLVVWE